MSTEAEWYNALEQLNRVWIYSCSRALKHLNLSEADQKAFVGKSQEFLKEMTTMLNEDENKYNAVMEEYFNSPEYTSLTSDIAE